MSVTALVPALIVPVRFESVPADPAPDRDAIASEMPVSWVTLAARLSTSSAVTVTEKFDPAVADAGVAVITSLLGRLVTLMLGELTNAVNALDDADVDFSRVAHDCAPVDAVAVAPDPVPALLPYTTLIVPPPANVTPVTVTT